MLYEISDKFNIDYNSLQKQYNRWCQIIYRQLTQIKKADFLDIGYIDSKNNQFKFHFYNERFINPNGFFPPLKFVTRTIRETDNNLRKNNENKKKTKRTINKTLIILPLLLLFTLMTSGYLVNKERINNYLQGIKLEKHKTKKPKKIKTKAKSSSKYLKTLDTKSIKKDENHLNTTKKVQDVPKLDKKNQGCMIVTGSFRKVKNLKNMEKALAKRFPDQIIKNIHGEYTRIGLQISCQDDTSLAKIKQLITEDAWLLKN